MRGKLLAGVELFVRFFRWWGTELGSAVHDLLAIIAPRWRRAVTVYIDAKQLIIVGGDSTCTPPLVEIARSHLQSELPADLPEEVSSMLEKGRRVRLVLAAEHAFVRQLRLPMAALPHLKSAVSLQLSKLLPIEPALLLTDFVIAASDPQALTLDIDLASVRRSDVERITKRIQGWGLQIASIQLADTLEASPRFRFESKNALSSVATVGRVDRVLMGTAAALGLACSAVAITQSYRAERALDYAADQAHQAAGPALGRRQHLLARMEPLAELSRQENSAIAGALLTEITALVPRDSWLTTFELKEHHVRLVGITPDSAALVTRLASSAMLTEVELRTSMSAGIGTGKDRFEIAAETRATAP